MVAVQAGCSGGMRLEPGVFRTWRRGHDWTRLDIDSTAGYDKGVKRRVATTNPKNGASRGTTASPLGRDLSKIAERIASSGIKPLNRKEVAREVSERRGGR